MGVEVVLGTEFQLVGKAVRATVADILRVHDGVQPHVGVLRLVADAGDESVADGILQDVLHEVELWGYRIFHHSCVGLVALFKFSQDMLLLARQRNRADGVHECQVEHVLYGVGEVDGAVEDGIEGGVNLIAHELEHHVGLTFAGQQGTGAIVALYRFRAEPYHVELSLEDGLVHSSRLDVHVGLSCHQLRVVRQAGLELQDDLVVDEGQHAVLVEMLVVLVEGRQNMVFVEADVVDVGGHELHNSWQRPAVMPDGAVAYLPLRFILVDAVEAYLVVRLRHEIAVAVGYRVHVGNKPQRGVATPDVEVTLDIDIAGVSGNVVSREIATVVEESA